MCKFFLFLSILALLHHIHGNGVQLVTGSSIGTPKVKTDAQVTSIQGALIGSKSDKNFPILVSAHYDSMSPAAVIKYIISSRTENVKYLDTFPFNSVYIVIYLVSKCKV